MTVPQHMTALATANATRLARTGLRRQVRGCRGFEARCDELAKVLSDGVPACMRSMRIEDVLRWLTSQGQRIDRFINGTLDAMGCTEWKTMGELTVRQRSVLVNVLRAEYCEREAV